jgi:hypothetical protein
VPDGGLGGRPIVDADEVDCGDDGGIDDHGGQAARQRRLDGGVAVVQGVQDEAVDGGVADGLSLAR